MSQFTTVSKVREVSGFTGSTNVTDAFISRLITRADSMVNAHVGDVYSLPVGKYYSQTIVFSGTGSGTATMTITINGTNYTVAVVSSQTASQAADLFRASAASSTSFVVDSLGNGATVTFYSKVANDSTDVTITSTDPQTVSGITATGGTVTEIAPPMLEMLSTQIAAAYLLIAEYGAEAQDTDKDGNKLLALWRGVLEDIQAKKEKVFDFAGVELTRSGTKRLTFYPNDTSETDTTNPTASKFTMNQNW